MSLGSAKGKLVLDRIGKTFDNGAVAVLEANLEVKQGEFFSLLGPSGCGKTTCLRIIAGFETPTTGRVLIGDRDITHVPAHERNNSMVFQNYALFPHRTVFENVAFGLRMRGMDRSRIAQKVNAALAQVQLQDFADRRPAKLSGGQQQRVALARAIVTDPPVLLCDEPLAALDRSLRQAMQFELKELQRRLGVTLLFVTHDQDEAMAMSDRVAIMNRGAVEQVGRPQEIYDAPNSRFVAGFVGDCNVFEGRRAGGELVTENGWRMAIPDSPSSVFALRPEKIDLAGSRRGLANEFAGRVSGVNFLGSRVIYRVAIEAGPDVLVQVPNDAPQAALDRGGEVFVSWQTRDIVPIGQ